MQLHCSIHEKTTFVEAAKDFKNVGEGGCDIHCNELMECGHQCPSLCHPTNRDHKQIRCREPCKKLVLMYFAAYFRLKYNVDFDVKLAP